MTYNDITNHLYSLANPEIAKHSQRFFKTAQGEYGFGDKFLGIRVPILRQKIKKYNATSVNVVKKLLKSEYHEVRLFSLLMLVSRFSNANADEKHEIYNLYLNYTQYINSWDLVDCSAHKIVGAYLEDKERTVLYDLTKSNSLWERRIAIISTYHLIRNSQYKDTLLISEKLLNDQEDLIHKAVGWMLREVGKRNLALEVNFLEKHYQEMPRTMLRYAIEKFSNIERKKYLSGLI